MGIIKKILFFGLKMVGAVVGAFIGATIAIIFGIFCLL